MHVMRYVKNENYINPDETAPHFQVSAVPKPRTSWTVRRADRFEAYSEMLGEENPVVRAYEVWGKSAWHCGSIAAKLELDDVFVIQLRVVNDRLIVEAKVLLNVRARRMLGLGVENAIELPLSGPEDDLDMRRLAAVPTRLGSWANERLGPTFEAYLADKGLKAAA